MPGHVFISHAPTDRAYVDRFALHLGNAGVPVWYGDELSAGQRFDAEIQRQIDACAAFVVVLSPESVASEWVGREIAHAQYVDKPVLPLMLRPCQLPTSLMSTPYEDVTSGRFPDDRVVGRLLALTGSGSSAPAATSSETSVAAPSGGGPTPSAALSTSPTAGAGAHDPQPSSRRMLGTVRWFSLWRGLGFITPAEGGQDIFVHYTDIEEDGIEVFDSGTRVEFEIEQVEEGPKAAKVRVIR